ncbi:hypothetical protein RJD11_12075 [Bacillus velezensis]|uniref:hypothetical protein n=2 Tax=Bacillaceae TaxID=186817 RepID=UPI001E5671C7|nr:MULTISPECIES: hypothetical protein [Bacillus amyloliquefaciens group]UHH01330.1 hypothetical protein LUA14_12005 [Bacillus amyloliquefaciens]ULR21078.1 hypothetical protein MJE83_12005 [Bacillus velezensis]UVW07821.1 hypothetical protein NX856_12045 [Bacillus velezensis]WHL75127.1 hypothetical protein QLH34_12025 [Bacillus velezensis]WNP87086.1 hypothetical protein RJD11_12075 [Bacillus velezensis]
MKVNCDTCNKSFDVWAQERQLGKGIVETFFVCPHCKRHYTSAVTNHEIRKKIAALKVLWEIEGPPTDKEARKRYDAKAAKLKTTIDQKMAELKRKVCGKNERKPGNTTAGY